jgi:glycosyltransferase involved in cell wall biosynthesis
LELKRLQCLNILHWHDLTPNCWTTRTLKRHFPLVWTNHTSNYLEYCETNSGRRKIKRYLHHADAIISPSKELNEKSILTGIEKDWLYYISNGVDSTKFNPTISSDEIEREYNLDPDKPIIICPRRLEPKNGVEYFVRSIPIVRTEFPDSQFLIVGGGFPDEKVRFENYLLENKQRDAVVFTDNVPNTLMPQFYALSDIAVLPSLMEATSISGLEAMACGLPLIGTNVGGIPEIIEREKSGILIEPRNYEQLAKQIIRLLNDETLRKRLGKTARQRVEQIFSWDVIADRTLEVYETVIYKRKQLH